MEMVTLFIEIAGTVTTHWAVFVSPLFVAVTVMVAVPGFLAVTVTVLPLPDPDTVATSVLLGVPQVMVAVSSLTVAVSVAVLPLFSVR